VFFVQAGIDNEPPGAEFFGPELSQQTFEIIFVPARFSGEVLGVKAPPFATCRNKPEGTKLSERWKILVLDDLSEIEVMAWYGLMINQAMAI
jgi:hypothetical protein